MAPFDTSDRPSLTGPRLKLARAKEQLDELEPEMRAYSHRKPFRLADEPDVEGDWMVIRYVKVSEVPDPRWGIRIGEFLHDLRSALDNLVWQLVLVNGEEPGDHNQFPIYTEGAPGPARLRGLKGRLPRAADRIDEMLFGVPPGQIAVIKELQPYAGLHVHRAAKIALAAVADLNNIDKHKVVHAAIAWAQREGREAKPTHLSGPAPRDIEIEHMLGPIHEGAEAFRWRIVGGTPETKVAMEGGIPFDVTFGNHPNLTLSNLDWVRIQIAEIIERFATAFPSDPDGA